jgi:hypothetical protein
LPFHFEISLCESEANYLGKAVLTFTLFFSMGIRKQLISELGRKTSRGRQSRRTTAIVLFFFSILANRVPSGPWFYFSTGRPQRMSYSNEFSQDQMSEPLHQSYQRRNDLLRSAKRVVIKLGTSTVTGSQGELSLERIEPIVGAIATLQTNRRQVVLVSSGAVGLGRGWLGLHPSRLKDMVTKQACAAVGQSLLMEAYKRLFGVYDVKIAQVLLTEEDFSNWQRYSNLRRTMDK